MLRLLTLPVRLVVRSALMRFLVYVGVLLALLGMVGTLPAWGATARTACGSTVTWSVSASLVTPGSAEAAVAAAYEQVAGPARLDVQAADAGTVRYLWIDRGTGSSETPATSQGTSVLGGTVYTQHAYLPGAEGTALKAQVLRDVLKDLGVTAPTSGATLSAADRAALVEICAAAPVAAPSVTAAPGDVAPAEQAPTAAPASQVDDARPSNSEGAPASTTLGLALVAVGILGVVLYLAVPPILPRLRRKPAAPAEISGA